MLAFSRWCRISAVVAGYLQVMQNICRWVQNICSWCRIAEGGVDYCLYGLYIPRVRPPRQGRAGTLNVAGGQVAPL
jgi:hypothetical protein